MSNNIFKFCSTVVEIFATPAERFTCGDCERNAQCGLPPHNDCVERLTQMARDKGDVRPPQRFLFPAAWPHGGVC